MTTEEFEAIDVGANVKRLREARGLSQKALAEKAGMKQSAISHIEVSGRDANPTLASAVLIADALGVGISELIAPPEALGTSLEVVREYVKEQAQVQVQETAPPPKPPKPDKRKFTKLRKLVKERLAIDEMVLMLGKGYISFDEKLELRRITTQIINEIVRLYKKGELG